MNGLKDKIIKGKFPKIPEIYSFELQELVRKMLSESEKRITLEELLEIDIIKKAIPKIIEKTLEDVKLYASKTNKTKLAINHAETLEILKKKNSDDVITAEKIEAMKIVLEKKMGSDDFVQLYNILKVTFIIFIFILFVEIYNTRKKRNSIA